MVRSGQATAAASKSIPGLPLGSEPYWNFWMALEDRGELGARTEPPSRILFATLASPKTRAPTTTSPHFDFDKDPELLVQGYSDMEASGTDLSKFKARGGKLLIYQGLARCDRDARGDAAVVRDADQGHGRGCGNHGIRAPVHGPRHEPLRRPVRSRRRRYAASIRCRPSRSGSRRACRPRASS